MLNYSTSTAYSESGIHLPGRDSGIHLPGRDSAEKSRGGIMSEGDQERKDTHCVDEVYSYCLCSFLRRYWRLETISVPYAVCRPLDGT